ncbi:MAG: hypothetical protein LBD59_10835 [Prevotellaceae bacterium]|jgi:hypothetical protein|nr:hypothetical protein [Prevotellaceae bacterium]
MQTKILKLSIIGVLALSMAACGNKPSSVFKDISEIEATSTKKGFLSFKMFFPENKNPYVRYIDKDGALKPEITIVYSRKETDKQDNTVIYFFTDEWNGEYQIRVDDDENPDRMWFVSKKLDRNVPYLIAQINYQDGTTVCKNVEKLYVGGQKTNIVNKEKELLYLLQNKKYLDFKKQFMDLIISNDTTMDYPFKRLINFELKKGENLVDGDYECYSNFNLITSEDRNIRFYGMPSNECAEGEIEDEYDATTDFYQFVQFRDCYRGVQTQIIFGGQTVKDYESVFTVNIGRTVYYIATHDWWSVDGQCKYIKAYTIVDNHLTPAKIFKLENLTLTSSLTSVSTYNGGMKISYNKKEKILSIENWKNGIEYYQLKDNLFQYIKNTTK